MHTVVIGVRHRNAPIEIRERLSFPQADIPDALREMLTLPGIVEGAILSTCNRTEVYATVTDTEMGIHSLKTFLSEYKQFDYNRYMEHAFILLHEDAVMHLFRVASGLDSLILGEDQILAQVKDTLKQAMSTRASGEIIERMFKTALSVGKAVRSETGITQRDISVSRAAFEFVKARHPDFQQKKVAVIGAGKMAEIIMASLKAGTDNPSEPDDRVMLVNRSPERVKALSHRYGFPSYGWAELPQVVRECDTVFVATGSPHFVLHPEAFEGINGSKIIVDISVPRNVDPEIGNLEGVQLYNTDNLQGYSEYTGENRLRLIQQAHQIIEREYQKYHQWLVSRSAIPMIVKLRERIEDIRRHEVARIEASCPELAQTCGMIDDLSRALVNKIMHMPTVNLRSTPQLEEIYEQAELLSRLFDIPTGDQEPPRSARNGAKIVSMPLSRK